MSLVKYWYLYTEYYSSDVVNIIKTMSPKPLSPDLMVSLIRTIGVVPVREIAPDMSELCHMWLHHSRSPSLDKLVKVLLCTPGAGHLVTGLVPICEWVLSSSS